MAILQPGADGGLLYRTDFENFVSGDDKWVGTDGWIGNNTGRAVHGIDQDVIPNGGLGKTAFIGFNLPGSTLVFVAKPILYAYPAGGLPLVRVDTLVGIQDSIAKATRDSFLVGVYNDTGNYLAGIRFDNRPASYGIWRVDGANPDHDTGVYFYRGELHVLNFEVNLPANVWSADLDGIPLFEGAPFTATANAVNFGYLAYEWQIGSAAVTGYGDNWMLVADTVVRSAPLGIEPFTITTLTRSAAGTTLAWPGQRGFDYQVEYSDDLHTWRSDLPGMVFPAITADQTLLFSDPATHLRRRFFRVLRTETP